MLILSRHPYEEPLNECLLPRKQQYAVLYTATACYSMLTLFCRLSVYIDGVRVRVRGEIFSLRNFFFGSRTRTII